MLEYIANGILWLDHYYPGWMKFIDLNLLDMSDVKLCVMGQLGTALAADWSCGPSKLMALQEDSCYPYQFGFSRPPICCNSYEYEELTEAWKEKILTRRSMENVKD